MPAIANSPLNYTLSSEKVIYPSHYEHLARQTCNLWGGVSLASYFPALSYAFKAGVDLVAYTCISRVALPKNSPGHSLPLVGKAINWLWKNPLKATFVTLIASAANSLGHLSQCLGHHAFTARWIFYSLLDPEDAAKFDVMKARKTLVHEIAKEKNISLPADFFDQVFGEIKPPSYYFDHMPKCLNKVKAEVLQDSKLDWILSKNDPQTQKGLLENLISQYTDRLCNKTHSATHDEL